jgi:hypothetical protein
MSNNLFLDEVKKQQDKINSGQPISWVEGETTEEYIRSAVRTAIRSDCNSINKIKKYIDNSNLGNKFSLKQIEKAIEDLVVMKEIRSKGRKTYSWVGVYK